MSVRRLAEEQPESFAFTPENLAWAKQLISHYPQGKQASAVLPLLWRAQEQNNGWVSRKAIETVASMLDMSDIRVLEVATFYTMFQLAPVGTTAHIQVCGTTPCMLRGAEDLKKVCRRKIHDEPHHLSADGAFSWEEVECLGACVNAPMVQIWKDTFEDLTPETFEKLIDDLAAGKPVKPGPQIDRQKAAPAGGPTTLTDPELYSGKRVFTRVEPAAPAAAPAPVAPPAPPPPAPKVEAKPEEPKPAEVKPVEAKAPEPKPVEAKPVEAKPLAAAAPLAAPVAPVPAHVAPAERSSPIPAPAPVKPEPKAKGTKPAAAKAADGKPELIKKPRGKADDLKLIWGVGPKLEKMLNDMGIWHFDQIASWSAKELAWVDERLEGFKGRAKRDDWIKQSKKLATGWRPDSAVGEKPGKK